MGVGHHCFHVQSWRILHLLGNMLFLYLYGDNVEDAMGKARFFLFFLLCGITAAFAQAFLDPNSRIPMVRRNAISEWLRLTYCFIQEPIYGYFTGFSLFWHHSLTRLLNFGAHSNLACYLGIDEGSGGVAIAAHLGGFGAGVIDSVFPKKKS